MRAAQDAAFPFRILIVSRPEKAIRWFFARESVRDLSREVFLDEKYNPDADIKLYLRSKFAEIRRSYDIPSTWPQDDDVQSLVDNASGQFIYAATVMRYISDAANPPQAQLEQVLNVEPAPGDEDSPLATLHALYTRILSSSPNPLLAVKWIWITGFPIGEIELPAIFWKRFLESSQGEAGFLLSNLTSLISIPPADDHLSPFRFYHKTLIDFLETTPQDHPLFVSRWYGDDCLAVFAGVRLVEVLKGKKGPAVLTSETEREAFVDHLFASSVLQAFIPRIGPWFDISTPNGFELSSLERTLKEYSHWTTLPHSNIDVLTCDVEWWIERLMSRYETIRATVLSTATASANPWRGASLILAVLFWEAHPQCPWYLCLPVCKHCRKAILKVCLSHGWGVPGKLMLLRNRFVRWTQLREDEGEETLSIFPSVQHFEPPLLAKGAATSRHGRRKYFQQGRDS
ncbi:hypothetical protein NMY22_g17883 [Coprinellus aureogranulatus]|nr:hypothetical protein NMY22_g17883 [Coprinellus aureogranulatus]